MTWRTGGGRRRAQETETRSDRIVPSVPTPNQAPATTNTGPFSNFAPFSSRHAGGMPSARPTRAPLDRRRRRGRGPASIDIGDGARGRDRNRETDRPVSATRYAPYRSGIPIKGPQMCRPTRAPIDRTGDVGDDPTRSTGRRETRSRRCCRRQPGTGTNRPSNEGRRGSSSSGFEPSDGRGCTRLALQSRPRRRRHPAR
jgi:hypothetical protein